MAEPEPSINEFIKKYFISISVATIVFIVVGSILMMAQRQENIRIRSQRSIPPAMIQGNGMIPVMMPQNQGLSAPMVMSGPAARVPARQGQMGMMPAAMTQGMGMQGVGNMVCTPPNCVSPNPAAPLITRNAIMPHGWRGICSNCHAILGPRPIWVP